MTRDPFLDDVEAEQQVDPAIPGELGELGGCVGIMLALFGVASVLGAFAALAMVLR